ncbi:MAG: hypothetical protein ABI607_02270 [Betaproteobacteria bacterium]
MAGIAFPDLARQRLWLVVLGAAVLLGAWLRLDQIAAQVLIDDEWHAVHQFVSHSPREMFFDFGYADYSIPLGMLDWLEAQAFGVSELTLRWPMLVCGLATLVLLPLYVAPRLGRATAAVLTTLIALSPLLVIFSRMARPYAITLLLGWSAHAAYQRYHAAPRGQFLAAATYAVLAALCTWLHPVVGPFVAAPLLWGFAALRNVAPTDRRHAFLRWLALAAWTGAITAALVLPPLLTHPMSLAAKGGADRPGMDSLIGVWYAWLGTPSTAVVMACVAFAAMGAPTVWRALPVARTGALGLLLTLGLVMATGIMWSHLPVTIARYLLPFVPLLLVCVAAGTVRVAIRVMHPATPLRKTIGIAILVLPIALLAARSPLIPWLRHPNAQMQHLVYYIDFRPDHNPYLPQFEAIPLSPFWATLGARSPGSLRIAVAPFYFESYDWDAPRWERLSRQTVLPGYLTGLCVERRGGELPRDPRYRFTNAVHLADSAALRSRSIDYVIWQKPYLLTVAGHSETIGADTAHCEEVLRRKFGTPTYEDSHIIVFPSPSLPSRADLSAPDATR